MEALGGEVLVYSVDAADFAGMKAVLNEAEQRLGLGQGRSDDVDLSRRCDA